jgi:hypothetical protein
MGAFILAASILVVTLGSGALVVVGDMMSDGRGAGISCASIFFGGIAITSLVQASHWMPGIGW